MKSNAYKTAAIAVFILAGILAGLACLTSPQPKAISSTDGFSAIGASAIIKEISKKPHSVFDEEEHQRVLTVLVDELEKLGLETSLMNFTLRNSEPGNGGPDRVEIQNIHAKLDGKSKKSILLVAHYDSAYSWDFEKDAPKGGNSFGAADDGYGVAVILETVRAIQASGKPLENGIEILITDAEELGLMGAENELSSNPEAFKHVKLVINLEARGVKGPAVMFEAGDNNASVMDFYLKNAGMPLTYSFATDIYRRMPNKTDFTCFVERGFTGYNLAVLDNLDYYHTALDNYDNINLSSLQHYGEQVLPVVKAFAFTPSDKLPSFNSSENLIFFNILPGIIVRYSESVAMAILVLVLALYLLVMMFQKRNGNIKITKVLIISASYAGGLLLFGMLGTLLAYIMSVIFNTLFNLVYLVDVPLSDIQQLLLIALAACVIIMIVTKTKRKVGNLEAVLAGMTVNLLFSAASTVLLAGTSFLFAIPSLLASLYCVSVTLTKSRLLNTLTAAFSIITVLVIYIPVVYLVYLALTFGAAGIVTIVSAIGFITLIPVAIHYLKG